MSDQARPSDDALAVYSCLSKSVYGVRPRHAGPRTLADYRREMDDLASMLEREQAWQEADAREAGFASHTVRARHDDQQWTARIDAEFFGASSGACLIPDDHWDQIERGIGRFAPVTEAERLWEEGAL